MSSLSRLLSLLLLASLFFQMQPSPVCPRAQAALVSGAGQRQTKLRTRNHLCAAHDAIAHTVAKAAVKSTGPSIVLSVVVWHNFPKLPGSPQLACWHTLCTTCTNQTHNSTMNCPHPSGSLDSTSFKPAATHPSPCRLPASLRCSSRQLARRATGSPAARNHLKYHQPGTASRYQQPQLLGGALRSRGHQLGARGARARRSP